MQLEQDNDEGLSDEADPTETRRSQRLSGVKRSLKEVATDEEGSDAEEEEDSHSEREEEKEEKEEEFEVEKITDERTVKVRRLKEHFL
jgi:IMP dehydrogenase/GMP reductase